MSYIHNAILYAMGVSFICAGCFDSPKNQADNEKSGRASSTRLDAAVEAGFEVELIRPEEVEPEPTGSESAGSSEPSEVPLEETSEQARRPSSLFTDASVLTEAIDRDEDGGARAIASGQNDAAPVTVAPEAGVSSEATVQPVDSGPPRLPAPSKPGELVITEVMANPKTLTDNQGEWFEIHNPSQTATYNLRGCEIADDAASKCIITADFTVAPLAWATVARSSSPGFAPTYVCAGLSLTNSDPDQVVLRCGQAVIDRITYDKAKEAVSSALDGATVDSIANDSTVNWCAATAPYNGEDIGTPGAPNPACPK
jgi:hypothetical protein